MRDIAPGLALAILLLSVGPVAAQALSAALATIRPVAGQAVSGSAVLTDAGGETTMVVVMVSGLSPNTTYINHMHSGSCVQPGGIVYPLTDLLGDAQGRASATTNVNATLDALVRESFSLTIHAANSPSSSIACGAIVASAQQLPRTGGARGWPLLGFMGGLALLTSGGLLHRASPARWPASGDDMARPGRG